MEFVIIVLSFAAIFLGIYLFSKKFRKQNLLIFLELKYNLSKLEVGSVVFIEMEDYIDLWKISKKYDPEISIPPHIIMKNKKGLIIIKNELLSINR